MAVQRRCKNLCTLDTEVDPTGLDAGNGGLRNATEGRKLRLAQALQLADDSHRLARTDVDALFSRNELGHFSASDSHGE